MYCMNGIFANILTIKNQPCRPWILPGFSVKKTTDGWFRPPVLHVVVALPVRRRWPRWIDGSSQRGGGGFTIPGGGLVVHKHGI